MKIFVIGIGVFIFFSCSSIQAAMYLASIDEDGGDQILKKELDVRTYLEEIINSYENYRIKVYERTA
ncbi:MAG: hypothetical protein LBT87_04195, partial [Treponema sp.]|nr:hypothetical protein [Treponema sp.]